jgi:hypothetical protein
MITDEAWVRRELAKHHGVFTYRAGLAGQCWNPGQSGYNPIIGPVEVTYTADADGVKSHRVVYEVAVLAST